MKVQPIPHAIFETGRSVFIRILHHCSLSWKITPMYIFSSNLTYFRQKQPTKVKFLDFSVVRWKFAKFLISYLKPQISFSLTFASLFNFMSDKSSVLFYFKLYLIFTKGVHQSAKFQTFDCSCEISPNLYVDRLLLLKVHKVSAKKAKRIYVLWYWIVEQNLKENQLFVSKMVRIWWILIQALKSLKDLHFDWFLLCKVYNVSPKKVQRSCI